MEIISTPSKINLIPTTDFSYGKYSFEYFNYLQSLCYPYYNQDYNLIVAAATSAGKTIVAEQNIAYIISTGKKAVFLSPLKAVTQEKYDDWTDKSHYFSNFKIEILTGDHRLDAAKVKRLKEADLILLTSEMLDTRTRYLENSDNQWLLEVGVVVVDEAHLLTTTRGAALEVGLMRFSNHNKEAKQILLSATMSNNDEVGEWIENLNKKETKVISTTWRPVDLDYHYIRSRQATISHARVKIAVSILKPLICPYGNLPYYLTSPNETERTIAETRIRGIRSAGESDKESIKTLVFVHSKQEGKKLHLMLKQIGIKANFHNADLDKKTRNKLEKEFKSDKLDVLIATSTLAWGINMPARNVLILGNKRGPTEVEDIDIKQMIGRAGRFGMYERGDAYLLCDTGYSLSQTFEVDSQLKNKETLGFHVVAEVYSRSIKNHSTAWDWYERSLAATQTHIDKKRLNDFNSLNELKEIDILQIIDAEHRVTPYGKIARDLYLNPYDIARWRSNFNALAELSGWKADADLAWSITNGVSYFDFPYIPQDLKSLVSIYKSNCTMDISNKSQVLGALVFYRLQRSKGMYDEYVQRSWDAIAAPFLQLILRDSGRFFSAIKRLDSLENWHREKDIIVTQARIVSGVGEHLIELVSIPGVGETVALQLYESGLKTLKDVIKNKDNLSEFISRKGSITRIKKGLEELDLNTSLSTI